MTSGLIFPGRTLPEVIFVMVSFNTFICSIRGACTSQSICSHGGTEKYLFGDHSRLLSLIVILHCFINSLPGGFTDIITSHTNKPPEWTRSWLEMYVRLQECDKLMAAFDAVKEAKTGYKA